MLLTMATAKDVLDAEGVAVITGGASGFGLEAATQCAALGMGVAILDVSELSLPPTPRCSGVREWGMRKLTLHCCR